MLLESYRDLADSERMKGSYFEQLVARYLENDGVHALQYTNVWLWRDWPERDGKKDNGIDLVAERQDGGFTAIQCKFYAEGHRIQKSDIDSFISASGKPPSPTACSWTPPPRSGPRTRRKCLTGSTCPSSASA